MGKLLFGEVVPIKGLDSVADAFAGTVYSDIINFSLFHSICFIIHKGVGATGTSTITVEACDDVSGSNVTAVPFWVQKYTGSDDLPGAAPLAVAAAGFATTAGSSQMYVIMVDNQVLAATGYKFVRLKAVEVANDPVLGGILAIGMSPRYKDDIPQTAIA